MIVTIKYFLSQFINYCVPLIIVGFIAPSITRLGSMILFCFLLGIFAIGAPGVPGGAGRRRKRGRTGLSPLPHHPQKTGTRKQFPGPFHVSFSGFFYQFAADVLRHQCKQERCRAGSPDLPGDVFFIVRKFAAQLRSDPVDGLPVFNQLDPAENDD